MRSEHITFWQFIRYIIQTFYEHVIILFFGNWFCTVRWQKMEVEESKCDIVVYCSVLHIIIIFTYKYFIKKITKLPGTCMSTFLIIKVRLYGIYKKCKISLADAIFCNFLIWLRYAPTVKKIINWMAFPLELISSIPFSRVDPYPETSRRSTMRSTLFSEKK